MKIRMFAALMLALAFFPLYSCADGSSAQNTNDDSLFSESLLEGDFSQSSPDLSYREDSALDTSSPSSSEAPAPVPPTPPTPAPPVVVQRASYVRCKADGVNIRSGAGTSFSTLGSAEKDTVYAVIEKTGNWYKTYYRGKIAYVYASYFSSFTLRKAEDNDLEKVISEGYKLLGTPYVYGAIRLHDGKGKLLKGFSTNKFDCSSLIQYIFYKGAGELLQMNTRTQVKQGKFVAKADLQRGDCIFFTNAERQNKTGVERIGHVALYLGNDYILHTASDYARIEKMTAKRWSYYVEARRFL